MAVLFRIIQLLVKIGDLGANSLVTEGKQFPANSLIMGSPAKVVRELSEDEIQFLKLSAEHYVEKSKLFSQDLKHET